MKQDRLIYDVATKDIKCYENKKQPKSYKYWLNMLTRCYNKKYLEKHPSYNGCKVCEEWLLYSNFKKWFDANYKDGYALDKDILIKGNKIYSKDACVFVPQYINKVIIHNQKNSKYTGIYWDNESNKWHTQIKIYGRCKNLGRFNTKEEAYEVYKQAKNNYIKDVALKAYKDNEISEIVYKALINYTV